MFVTLYLQKWMPSWLVSLHRPFSGSWTWLQPSPDTSTSLTTIIVSSQDTWSRSTPGKMLCMVDFVWRVWLKISALIISVIRDHFTAHTLHIGFFDTVILPKSNFCHHGLHFTSLYLANDQFMRKTFTLDIELSSLSGWKSWPVFNQHQINNAC